MEKKVVSEDIEGDARDVPGCLPTWEYWRIQDVYRYWLHSNNGAHLRGEIEDNIVWHTWW